MGWVPCRTAGLPGRPSPEDLLGRLSPEDLLGRLSPEDLPGRLSPEDLPGRLSPEDFLGRDRSPSGPAPQTWRFRRNRPTSEAFLRMPSPRNNPGSHPKTSWVGFHPSTSQVGSGPSTSQVGSRPRTSWVGTDLRAVRRRRRGAFGEIALPGALPGECSAETEQWDRSCWLLSSCARASILAVASPFERIHHAIAFLPTESLRIRPALPG